MRLIAVVGLFVLGFWVMVAGGIAGSAVHMYPSIVVSVVGCMISTIGLGFCLSGLAVARSALTRGLAHVLSGLGVLYGFYHSLINIIYQAETLATLIYGIYMSAISIIGVLVIRRFHIKAKRVAP
jgi:hypothetical protein